MIKAIFKAMGTCEQCLVTCEVLVELEGFHGRFSMPLKATWPESWRPVPPHDRAVDSGYVTCPECGHVGSDDVLDRVASAQALRDIRTSSQEVGWEPEPERPTAWAHMTEDEEG